MTTFEMIDVSKRKMRNEFIQFHYDLYRSVPQWVPPFYQDIELMLNRKKHPFYEKNDADFFVARDRERIVGRLAIMENRAFNDYHHSRKAQFYLFDSINDQSVFNGLFSMAADWCKQRGLTDIVGPKGFSAFDGYGIQVEGFQHRQMMTMMNYNFEYYQDLFERGGFKKEVDFVSCYLSAEDFRIPEKVHEVSRRVLERGTFTVKRFKSKREISRWANRIGEAYNNAFINNWEYYPLTSREIKMLLDNLLVVAVPSLVKIITYNEKVVGFLLAFPDISAALQKNKGKNPIFRPWNLVNILKELKNSDWVAINGAGVLPEFHGRGGNALLYSEMEKTIQSFHFSHAELTQVAETASQMRRDLITAGGQPYKNHRIYKKQL